MDRHGQIAQVDCQLVVPRVPPARQLGALLRLHFLARAQERALAHDEQHAVLAQVRELKHDVCHPEARRPQRDGAVADASFGHGGKVVRAEEGELLEGVEDEHRPALRALDGVEAACGRRGALEGDEPLDDGQYPWIWHGEEVRRMGKVKGTRTPEPP